MLLTPRLEAAFRAFFAKAAEKEPDYAELHRVADRKVPAMAQAFLNAVLRLQDAIVLDHLAEAIQRRDFAAAEATIPWDQFESHLIAEVRPMLRDLIRDGAIASVITLPETVRLTVVDGGASSPPPPPPPGELAMNFNLTSPTAIEWVHGHAADLVTEVSRETQLAVRDIVGRAFTQGGHPYEQAREIRQSVGLTVRQATAVENYRSFLVGLRDRKSFDKLPKGVTEALEMGGVQARQIGALSRQGSKYLTDDRIDKLVAKRTEKWLKYRSEMIARHETLVASNQGRMELWEQGVAQGVIDTDRARLHWINTPDRRLCEHCRQMVGDRAIARMGQLFDTPLGMMAGPPMHILCRCAASLFFVS